MAVCVLGLSAAQAAVSVTTATGGSAISADSTGGTYTSLTGPVLTEGATADIGTGTIILNAPSGFQFDTGGTAPTVLMTRVSGSGPDSRNINDVASGTSMAITSRTTSQITFTVTAATASSVRCSLTWQNVRVRPTAGTPLASGNLTKTGTATVSGVTGSTNLGTLTEVVGAAATLAFTTQPASAVVGAVFGTQPVVKTRDQFGNNSVTGLPASRNVTVTLTGGTGPLQGTATLDIGTAAGNGTVTFTNLRIDVVGANKQLTAAASGLTSGVSSIFTVSQGSQTTSFGALTGKTYGNAPFSVSATATSGLSVTFSIVSGPATVLGNTVTLTGAGTVIVRASQAGDANWSAAANVDQSFSVAQANLTVSGITASNKIYDGNTSATLNTGSAALVGVIGSDVVTLNTGSAAGAFANKTVGTGKAVTVSGLTHGGANAGNYTLTQPSTTADITTKPLSVSGVTASNKVYEGNTTATLNTGGAALVGVVGGDTVNLNTGSATGAFANKNVGTGKTITVSGITISGTDSANYSVTQPAATADITVRSLTVSATGVNKVYDGTTTATVTLSDNRVGGDVVTTTYTAADFADKTVGTSKSVGVSGIAISGGADAGNYSANATASATANITAKGLTVTGITANHKIYDGNTTATLNTGSAALVGVVGGDTVNLNTGSAAGAFANKNVGTGKTVTVSGLALGGADAGNYSLTQPSASADITTKALTVSGITASDKVYNGNPSATLNTGSAALVGVVGADVVTLSTGSAAGAFADALVGAGKVVTISGLTHGGADAGNYSLTQPAATADITAKALTVSGITANNKGYDGSTTAWLNTGSAALVGVIGADVVTLNTGSAAGAFANKNVGTGKTVTVSGLALGGADAGNYSLTQPATTADITTATLTVSGITANNKVYDGNTSATLNTGSAALIGVIGADVVTLNTGSAAGAFANKTVAAGKSVTISGLTINGADAGNYALTQPGATADITVRSLTVSATGVNKVYDGTTTASVTLSDDRVGADDVTTTYTTADFADALVGTGKSVGVSGIAISGGADAGNYTANAAASTTADITVKTLTVTGVTANNKVYDGNTTAALNTGSAALVGVIGGDAVTLNAGSAVGVFADEDVGTGISVAVSGMALSGADAGNYSLTQPTTSANITTITLTVSGVTANNKVYDGNTTASINTGSAALVGVIGGDAVTLNTGGATGTFADEDVATGIAVAVSGLALGGADAGNYALTQPSTAADITTKTLTVSGITASNKVYDGNTTATLNTGSAALVGVVGGDGVTLNTGSAAGAFANKTVGTAKPVTISGLTIGGADAGNYSLTQPSTTANITAATLTVSGITANNKVYDATTTATLNTGSAALVGVIGADAVTLNTGSATGAFANKTVGTGKTVTVSGLTLSGADAGNYSLTQPTTSADITTKTLTVSGVTANNKVYDGNTTATLNTGGAALVGVIGADVVTLNTGGAASTCADEDVATGIAVTISGLTLSGADAGNYALTQPAATADITAKALTVSGITANNKVYDGSTTATLNTGSAALVGVVGADVVTLNTGGAAGIFANKNVGTAKTVSVSGLTHGGTDAGNYTLTQPSTTADITPLAINLSGTRAYDGTTEAVAGILTIDNNLDGLNLTLSGSATLASKAVGTRAISNRTVTRAQSATGNSGSSAATSFGVTLGGSPVSGNTLVAVIATRGTSANRVTSITQTGATWSRVSQAANGSGTTTEIWYAPNVDGAGTAITINQANLRSAAVVMEYSGVLSANPVDQTANATGNSTAAVTGTTPTTSQAHELWIGSIGLVNSGFTLGTPNNAFTAVANAQSSNGTAGNNAKVYALEKIVSATGTAASGGTVSSSSQWSGAIATFRTTPFGLAGSAAANYTLTGLSGSVSITAKPLTVSGITANNKTFDGNTSATLNTGSAALVGAVSTDTVTLNTAGAIGTFDTPSVGSGKTVTISGLTISGADAGNYTLTQPTTTANIVAATATVQFGTATTTWAETNTPIGIAITVSNASASAISVNYAATGGTADNGGGDSDYVLANGVMSIPAGVTSTTLYFTVVNDARDEHDQTIILQLSSPVNANLGSPTTHTVTLVDEDPLPDITFVGAPYTVAEAAGSKTITVTLSHQSDKDMRVWYATADGTAVAGSDYTAVDNNVRWPPPSNGTTKNWTIPILNDGRAEGDQYFWVCLVDTQNCAIPVTSACTVVTITDDDIAPTVTSGSGVSYPSPFEATLNGALTSTGTAATTVGFYWGPSNGGADASLWANSRLLSVQAPGPFSTVISNLVAGQTYYYAAFATNSAGEGWSGVVSFIGRGNEAPLILDSSVTNAAVTAAGTNYTGPTPVLVAGLPLPTWTLNTAMATAGATINPSSGLVTWTNPVYSGAPYTVTITASNAFGVDSASWQLRVVPGGDAVYVATTGSDLTGEGSPGRPFATISNAIAQRATLTNIYVASGTYAITSNARLKSTTALHFSGGFSPDFFTRDPNSYATILDGGNTARATPLFDATGSCAGLVLQQFTGATPRFAEVGDYDLEQCTFRNNAMGTVGFSMYENGRLTIDRCRFYDNSYVNGGNLVAGEDTAWTLLMVNSLFANGTGGARVCEARGGMVSITAVNCTFYNSTLGDNGVSYWRPSGPSVVHTQAFYNCLFWTANNGATPVKDSGTQGTVVIENCAFRTNGGNPWEADDVTLVTEDNLTGDPVVTFLSTNTSQANAFKPTRNSPTRNAGLSTAQNALVPLTDIVGEARIGQTDIGAFEWSTQDTTVFTFR